MKKSTTLAVALLGLALPLHAQAPGPVRDAWLDAVRLPAHAAVAAPRVVLDPELSKPRLYQSIPLAALLGVGGMLVGYGAGLEAFECADEAPGCAHGPDDFEHTLAFTGLALGAATGAHLGGKRRDSTGSFWPTVGGAAIGALPILLAPKDADQGGAYVGSMVAGTAGAVLVDYLVRRPR